ncbi:MAG: NPXTG-anchored protein [Ruminococcaceae bacterium]|nr:NPXTG-anchored protein [Oscillospiraceae bacterium]
MLKKILAASTAGVLALTALATTAMAADDYTIVFENVVENETVTLELTNELTQAQIKELLGNDGAATGDADNADGWDDSKNSYKNIVLSTWIKKFTNLAGKDKNGNTSGTYSFDDSKKDITFGGATVDVKLTGNIKEYVVAKAGETVAAGFPSGTYYSDGKTTLTASATLDADTLIPRGNSGTYAWFSGNNLSNYVGPTTNPEKAVQSKEFEKELTISNSASWYKNTNPVEGYASTPAVANGTFGLSALNQLQSIDYSKSSVKVSFTVSMPANLFRAIVSGSTDATWNWTGATWDNALISQIVASQAGQQAIADYFGIVGESGTGSTGSNFSHKGGTSSHNETKVTKSEYSTTSKNDKLPNHGKATIGLGINATPTRLKNLNNGGTITFEFDKDMWNGVFADVEVIFRAASGQVKYPLATDYKWSEDGKSITVPLPSGLTYNEQLNSFNSFSMEYLVGVAHTGDLVDLGSGDNIGQYWGNNPTFWDANVTKITITANKEAPADNNNSQGGLVSETPTSSTSTPSSTTNNGTSNGEKNPGTGVAVAVAPVVLAAAGAAVVISKKRK